MSLLRTFAINLFDDAVQYNHKNIISFFEKNPKAKFLDLGCDDGGVTLKMAKAIGTKNIYGVEIMDERIKTAISRGIKVKKFDLNEKFLFPTNTFDVVHANQVIEHLYDTDNFISEIYRVLKPGGYAIVSTENASSWVNIMSSILGFQIFSLTNFSKKSWAIGNPLSVHAGSNRQSDANRHVRIYNYRGLIDYFKVYGFEVEKVGGAGYYPLPTAFGNIEKVHSHFITVKVRKPL